MMPELTESRSPAHCLPVFQRCIGDHQWPHRPPCAACRRHERTPRACMRGFSWHAGPTGRHGKDKAPWACMHSGRPCARPRPLGVVSCDRRETRAPLHSLSLSLSLNDLGRVEAKDRVSVECRQAKLSKGVRTCGGGRGQSPVHGSVSAPWLLATTRPGHSLSLPPLEEILNGCDTF